MGHNPYPFHGSHTRSPARKTALRARTRSVTRAVSTRSGANRWIIGAGLLGMIGWMLLKNKASAATPTLALPAPSSTGGGLLTSPGIGLPIQAGTQSIPELPATMATTSDQLSSAGTFWDTLQPVQSLPSGYINFPSGAQAAAAIFQTRMDANGSYYVQWAGLTYVLGNQDSSGNWPAQAVA